MLLVKTEIKKLLKAGFIHPIDYSPWISNIFFISKPNSHIRICIEFHDINKASLKDDFLLPNIVMIVDLTAGHALLSFMDGFRFTIRSVLTWNISIRQPSLPLGGPSFMWSFPLG